MPARPDDRPGEASGPGGAPRSSLGPDPRPIAGGGRFFVLEGLDGAGTTTQSARLAAALRAAGREVVETREPTAGPLGRILRQSLRGEPDAPPPQVMPWLFAADRADHLARVVLPALARGADVVSDRYIPSSLAYQADLETPGPGEGLSPDADAPTPPGGPGLRTGLTLAQVWALNATFRVPDLVVFLDIPAEVGLRRIAGRETRDIFEERAVLERVRQGYLQAFAHLRALGHPVATLDGTQAPDAVEAGIQAVIGAGR